MPGRLLPGLCSVTFRGLSPDAVLSLAADSGLRAIEWGADVHLPPGDTAAAAALADRCRDAGIACLSYGSYYFAGRSERHELPPLLDTAAALGARCVRIWTPLGVESDAPETDRRDIAQAVAAAVAQARARDLEIALEFHPGTLTHTATSARALLDAVEGQGEPGLRTYWQPDPRDARERSLAEFRAVRDHLAHLHVFSWRASPHERLDLAEHAWLWQQVLAETPRQEADRTALLEFVREDDPDQLRRDARTLIDWLDALPD